MPVSAPTLETASTGHLTRLPLPPFIEHEPVGYGRRAQPSAHAVPLVDDDGPPPLRQHAPSTTSGSGVDGGYSV
ncbi:MULTISPECIES: hypothetical protein [unclassified Streptomyces]|uniref:hypothetical protein n=1 Tax=unclassified Streptomyces TaxID=2593676 RepID=UPI000DD5DED3|nr:MULTISPECIES: hypothetical protein [unclassified Streptomyces]QZZ31615.1 hypothetical protein A7X85_40215 [Streptomyces sp. ST1015]